MVFRYLPRQDLIVFITNINYIVLVLLLWTWFWNSHHTGKSNRFNRELIMMSIDYWVILVEWMLKNPKPPIKINQIGESINNFDSNQFFYSIIFLKGRINWNFWFLIVVFSTNILKYYNFFYKYLFWSYLLIRCRSNMHE